MEQALVDKDFLLEKFPGKGGWTFAVIPEIAQNKNTPFGWVKVRGYIDAYEISKYHLMPMGNGTLFLPVKAEIRKKIKKQAGDYVRVKLYVDNEPIHVPEDMWACLQDEPSALQFFESLEESEKQNYLKWVYSAKTETTKVERMAKSIDMLAQKQKLNDKLK